MLDAVVKWLKRIVIVSKAPSESYGSETRNESAEKDTMTLASRAVAMLEPLEGLTREEVISVTAMFLEHVGWLLSEDSSDELHES